MKFAFYSAALGDLPLAEVAEWGRQAGFDGLEIDIGRHVNDPTRTTNAVEIVRGAGLEVCGLTVFGNLLDQHDNERNRLRDLVRRVLAEASKAGVPALVVFPGRNETISEDENYHDFAAFLKALAAGGSIGTKILIENWPGRYKNFIATTPHGWRKLFSIVKSPDIGLEFDPSHLLWQGIDPSQAAGEFRKRIFLLHAKDSKLFRDRIQDVGYCGSWWEYRLPGRGEIDWRQFLGLLSGDTGYTGFISIEHEDTQFGWPNGPVELRKEGLLKGLATLRGSLASLAS
jgi:sugar phosphate isomerase/epimerase